MTEQAGHDPDAIDLDGVLRALWRRRALIGAVTGGALAACALVLFQLTPLYTAQVLIRLNDRQSQVVAVPEVLAGLPAEAPTVQSEVEILRSRAMAEAVVADQGLTTDPEFNPLLAPPSLPARLLALAGLGGGDDGAAPATARTVEAFRDALSVGALNRSYVIRVAVASEDPDKAARLAAATARLYVARQVETKEAATRAAVDWLAGRIAETRAQVAAAEAAIAAYRAEHGLGQPADGTLAARQRDELTGELVAARAARAAVEARLERLREALRAGGLQAVPDILASPLIQRLREQEAEVRRRVADLSSRYGEKHPRMIDARAELAGLTTQIGLEAEKIAAAVETEARAARAQERALTQALDGLEARRADEGRAALGLAEMEREAEALRALHQTFLARHKETTNRLGLHEPDAAIVSPAAVPQRPSWPRKGLSLVAAGGFGLFVALALVYIVERLDRRLRRPEDAERLLGLPCLGQAPRVRTAGAPWMMSGAVQEEMRNLRMALRLTRPLEAPRVVAVTSSNPGEGKSTLCLWLACEAAAGRRVVLVDADLRRPGLTGVLDGPDRPGLAEVLSGAAPLDAALRDGPMSGLSLLPSRPVGGVANDLLSATTFQALLDALRERFDMVVIDTPPVLPVADARLVTPYADAVLYAVRWEATPWPVAAEGLARLREGDAPEPRVVLTQVDLKRQNSYGYGGNARAYATYGAYYGA